MNPSLILLLQMEAAFCAYQCKGSEVSSQVDSVLVAKPLASRRLPKHGSVSMLRWLGRLIKAV